MLEEYDRSNVPDYLQTQMERGNRRHRYPSQTQKNNEIMENLVRQDEMTTYNAFDEDIAIVHFYFKNPTTFEYRRYPSLTLVGFFSQIGGLFGLCLGFSFLSLVEILYWAVVRLGRTSLAQTRSGRATGPTNEEGRPPAAIYNSPDRGE